MNDPTSQPEGHEAALVAQAQAGDREAFGELVLRHREGVVNLVYRMSGDANLAEDIAQEAFITAWEKLSGYLPIAPFRSWVYRIAMNAAMDYFRKQKKTVDLDQVELANPGSTPENTVQSMEIAARVQGAVLLLPAASRSVLILREYLELSYREIAETLEIPVGTVMSRLNYARTVMRKALSAELEEL